MKDQFPIFKEKKDWIYFDSAATTQKPKCVIDALQRFYSLENATVHRAIYKASLIATEKYNDARETIQRFLNADSSSEIVFTRGTTSALNFIAQSYGDSFLEEGDEILISVLEHHSNLVPWQMLAQRKKAKLSWIPIDEQGNLKWEGKITKRTKIVSIAHVSNVTGAVHPIFEMGKKAHEMGAVLVVDGAQAAPHIPIDVQKLNCDFYAFSSHKCYGPTGIGALFGKKELLEKMPPIEGGGDMIEKVTLEKTSYRAPPYRFEAGTPSIAQAIGFKEALDFLMKIGSKRLLLHGNLLLKEATSLLKEIPGLRILGESPQKTPLITFDIEGVHPLDLSTFLDLQNISIRSGHLCAQPAMEAFGLSAASRISFGLYNSIDEIEFFIKSLKHSLVQLV